MTDFEKTILWLADVYPNTQIKPKRDIADAFLRRFSGSSDIDKVIDAILNDESRYPQNGDTEIVLSFTMMVLTLYEQVSAQQSYSSSDVIGYLEDMILINSELAQYFMNHSFKAGSSLCDGGGYNQSAVMINFLKVLKNDADSREMIQQICGSENIILGPSYRRVAKYDLELLGAHLEYLLLVAILMCLSESPYFSSDVKSIAHEILLCFKDLFSDSRIEYIFMEPNVFFSEQEQGIHATTKFEIFFVQSNNDRYCLRLDFPHDDINYVHFNLHEPFRETAFPISNEEYADLTKEIPSMYSYFYEYSNSYWFRSNFERLIVEGHFEQEDSRKKLRAVYERQKHYRFLKSKYSSDQVKTFLNVVFTAASSIGMSRSRYQKPKEVDWKERLLTITLRERIRVFNYAADGLALQQLMDAVHPKDKKQMLEAKCSLIWTLQNECGTASIEDLIELSDECLLDLAEAEIKSRENSTN